MESVAACSCDWQQEQSSRVITLLLMIVEVDLSLLTSAATKRELLDLKDRLDLDSGSGGKLGEAQGAAGVVAVAFFAEDLM